MASTVPGLRIPGGCIYSGPARIPPLGIRRADAYRSRHRPHLHRLRHDLRPLRALGPRGGLRGRLMSPAARNLGIFAVALVALFGLAAVAGLVLDPDAPVGEAGADDSNRHSKE